MLNIDLAAFDHIFLLDPSHKSTFAQKQSCRSSLPLQLLFWPNFKFLYENFEFQLVKLEQKSFKRRNSASPVLDTVPPRRHTGVWSPASDATRRQSRPGAALLLADALEASLPVSFPFCSSSRARRAKQREQSSSRWPFLAVPPRTLRARAPQPHPAPLQHLPELV